MKVEHVGNGALRIKVLDHGFVILRNISGPTRRAQRPYDADDIDVAQAARISFNQMDSERTRDDDMKLAKYLMKNFHTTPIEQIQVWLEMKLPIFVARQFVRHRTVSINECSARYIKLPEEWYIPTDVGGKPPNAKQGQIEGLPAPLQAEFKKELDDDCRRGYEKYSHFIEHGVAAEHARCFLHVNHYTHWIWSQDLHNMMHFLSLRDHSHAQLEAQLYAKAISHLLQLVVPDLMGLYDQYRRFE